jgi:hypothetical protein
LKKERINHDAREKKIGEIAQSILTASELFEMSHPRHIGSARPQPQIKNGAIRFEAPFLCLMPPEGATGSIDPTMFGASQDTITH